MIAEKEKEAVLERVFQRQRAQVKKETEMEKATRLAIEERQAKKRENMAMI